MFKKQHLALAIAATLAAANAQAFNADSFTVSGYVKNETAALTKDGTFNGQATSPSDTTKYNDSGDLIKSETSVKLFVNGDVGEGSSMHAELLLHNDSKAKGSHFKNSDSYTQSEFLRELYVDTTAGDWDVRVGKQQVVWGTADGAKFMDMINPTDYREMAQNAMAESRIPVWMINAEKYLDNGANIQVVLSQPRENVFAGLNRDIATGLRSTSAGSATNVGHDKGNPYILKGVDSITGEYNGFLNGTPDIGNIAAGFYGLFGAALGQSSSTTVGGFAVMTNFTGFSSISASLPATLTGYATNGGGNDGTAVLNAFAGNYDTNLLNATPGTATPSTTTDFGSTKDSIFEYMSNATFATFDTFANAKSEYVFDMPDDTDVDLSFRFKNSTSNGVNYSAAYSYNYDKNPVINLSWRDANTGAEVTPTVGSRTYFDGSGNPTGTSSGAYSTYTVTASGYGACAAGTSALAVTGCTSGTGTEYLNLRFTQTLERAHNIGGSFDFALDTESLGPVVIRGEGVYTKDSRQPIVDKGRLSIGDLSRSLTMQKADKFKYVIGADVTALTDMMVSAQFIQERNLDFVDTASDITLDTAETKYTADFASMHMTNGFKKALKNKEFYSLFLSKPFGDSGEGRWNNILMLEEGGGRWNRFDVEYSLSNDLIGSIEYNKYWGDANSQFGQLEAASNIQLGLKYLFE